MHDNIYKMTALSLLFCAHLPLKVAASPWESELELGFQRLTGNADSITLNSRLAVSYTQGPYRHTSELRFLFVEKDDEVDKHKSNFESQANYKYNSKSYILANINYLSDKYGPYFKDVTLSTGMGYQAIWQENLSLLFEMGPGYHYQRPNLDEIDDDDLILPYDVREPVLRGQSVFLWQITPLTELEARVTAISGKSNTSVESRWSITTDLIADLALKVSSTQKYINKVPPGLKNLDTIFTISGVYRF